ncbi:putative reverse transcriptase domain-containing protein [Tanacetum coccineum]
MGDVDINTLIIEQDLALTRGNQAPGVVESEIGNNVNFEIKSQYMRELIENTFSGNKNDDAHEHIEKVSKKWIDRISSGTINTWDFPKKSFIQRYCPPFMTSKKLEDIHNFKQEGEETLC